MSDFDYSSYLNMIALFGILFLASYNYIISTIANSFMYCPYKASKSELDALSKKYKRNEEHIIFNADDGTKLSGIFINYDKKASWDDTIFLYSHGNGSWIGGLLNSPQIKMLSKFGSVFAYDYRQYGLSEGIINEKGTYSDILGAWNYLTQVKNINPKKIIVYGHSMGGAISTKLLALLVEKYKNDQSKLPQALILDGTFSNVIDMGNHIFPGFGNLAIHEYDNIKNLIFINQSISILVMHSPDDETVPFNQSLKIKNNCKCNHVEINGTHNIPIFNSKVDEFISEHVEKCKNV